MIYMLDTNIISYLIKNRDFALIETFEKVSARHTVSVSSITIAELFYGVKKKDSKKLEVAIEELLHPLETYDFDTNAAFHYGTLRVQLESAGDVIGSHDMLIAAHAQSLDATLVTNNLSEFEKVNNLKLENWVK